MVRLDRNRVFSLLAPQLILVLALTGGLAFWHWDVKQAAAYYLTCNAIFLGIYMIVWLAQRRGLLPRALSTIKPVRKVTERGLGPTQMFNTEFSRENPADDEVIKERIVEDYLATTRSLLQAGRFQECADLLQKALQTDPANSRLLNYMGIAMSRLMRYEEAIAAYEASIGQDYDNAQAHFNLAAALENAERPHEAAEQYQRYLKIGAILGEPMEMLERADDRLRTIRSSFSDELLTGDRR
ncbi:MAG: tetratricopeptide repeat protein [Deltaproteobacteria bacterium]|nr:tetratricopeptide repeat protein [Deltaproteobacteria bacterium]